MNYKVCIKCGEKKSIDNFSKRGSGNKRRNICKKCDNARSTKHKKREQFDNSFSVDKLLHITRYDLTRLQSITKNDFERITKTTVSNFDEIKRLAVSKLESRGLLESHSKVLGDGTYLVVSNSFGKHTKTAMFSLLKYFSKQINASGLIHLGNALDDDGMLSNCFDKFSVPTIFVGKIEELADLYSLKDSYKFDIVTDHVLVGNVLCTNQDIIQPYTKQLLSSLDVSSYKSSVVVNNTRHEWFQQVCNNGDKFVTSPGTLAEPFVKQTVKQIDFTNGYKVKEAYTNTMLKYRRMREMLQYWEQGVIVIKVINGVTTTTPLKIKKLNGEYIIAYDGVIYTSSGNTITTCKNSFVIGDTHAPNYDWKVLSIARMLCSSIPDASLVMLGDMIDGRVVNPHIRSRREVTMDCFLDEYREYYRILGMFERCSSDKVFITGNHEDFYSRYTKTEPQFKELFKKLLKDPLDKFGYTVVDDKEVVDSTNSDLVYVHGDLKMFGQGGATADKFHKTFCKTVVKGHSHSAMIARDVYSIPCLCELNQGYNEYTASNWNNGACLVTEYNGINFVQLINFDSSGLRFRKEYFKYNFKYVSDVRISVSL